MNKLKQFFVVVVLSVMAFACNKEWTYQSPTTISGYSVLKSSDSDTVLVLLPMWLNLPKSVSEDSTVTTFDDANYAKEFPYHVVKPNLVDQVDKNFLHQYYISEEDTEEAVSKGIDNIQKIIEEFQENDKVVLVLATTIYASVHLLKLMSMHELKAEKYAGIDIRL